MVFEKMKLEGFSGNDDVRLKTVIRIPRSTVGRIIGKGGKNVREIQRLTGGIVKLPQEQAIQSVEDVPVEVHGNFMSTQVGRLFQCLPNLIVADRSLLFSVYQRLVQFLRHVLLRSPKCFHNTSYNSELLIKNDKNGSQN